jgi:hypothetical protein
MSSVRFWTQKFFGFTQVRIVGDGQMSQLFAVCIIFLKTIVPESEIQETHFDHSLLGQRFSQILLQTQIVLDV